MLYDVITCYLFLLCPYLLFGPSCIYIPHCLLIYTTRLFLTLLRIRLAVLVQQPAPECRIQILHQYLFVSFHRFDRSAWYVMCWVSCGCPDPDQKIRLGMLPATSSSRYGYIGYNNSRAEKRRWETLLEVGALVKVRQELSRCSILRTTSAHSIVHVPHFRAFNGRV